MGVNITTIVYLRVLIIQIGSTIILMVVEAQVFFAFLNDHLFLMHEVMYIMYIYIFILRVDAIQIHLIKVYTFNLYGLNGMSYIIYL